jgi:hypothetical protein
LVLVLFLSFLLSVLVVDASLLSYVISVSLVKVIYLSPSEIAWNGLFLRGLVWSVWGGAFGDCSSGALLFGSCRILYLWLSLVGLSFLATLASSDSFNVCYFLLFPPLSLLGSPEVGFSVDNVWSCGWISSILGCACSPGSGGSFKPSTWVIMVLISWRSIRDIWRPWWEISQLKNTCVHGNGMVSNHLRMLILTRWIGPILRILNGTVPMCSHGSIPCYRRDLLLVHFMAGYMEVSLLEEDMLC